MAHRGANISFGEYGLQALEPGWITNRQIEAARVAISQGFGAWWESLDSRFFQINLLQLSLQRPVWAKQRQSRILGSSH